jgi:hypothetical protein
MQNHPSPRSFLGRHVLKWAVALALLVPLGACTVVNTATIPLPNPAIRQPFVTLGDVTTPYESLGLVQITRKGVLLFGFLDPVGTEIQQGFNDVLIPLIRERGGDGMINVRCHQTQYLLPTKIIFAILFFVPLPTNVTITGEIVRLRPPGA